jgi:ABC-type transport system involved in multi-copper enzyme maturation permease subunit
MVTAYLVFYGGILFGLVACSDFAPGLLSPGRIEHLLALPVRRWQVLVGTFVGVMTLAVGGALYGAGGLWLILGVKTGYWTVGPLIAALLASVAYAAVYAVMLTCATLVRSAALCAAAGGVFLVLGVIAGFRRSIAPVLEEGVSRTGFELLTLFLPRLSSLANASASIAASIPLEQRSLGAVLAGVGLFGLGALSLGLWHFERKDY